MLILMSQKNLPRHSTFNFYTVSAVLYYTGQVDMADSFLNYKFMVQFPVPAKTSPFPIPPSVLDPGEPHLLYGPTDAG